MVTDSELCQANAGLLCEKSLVVARAKQKYEIEQLDIEVNVNRVLFLNRSGLVPGLNLSFLLREVYLERTLFMSQAYIVVFLWYSCCLCTRPSVPKV